MDPLYVLMSKSDRLQDLAMCVFGRVSFSSADPVFRRLYSLLFVLSSSIMGCTERHLSLSDLKPMMPMASLLDLSSFAYFCCFLDHRQRVHSAPLLRYPGSATPSQPHRNFSADVPLSEATTFEPSHTVVRIENTADKDTSVTVSRRDF